MPALCVASTSIAADEPYPSFKVQCQRLTQAKQLNPDLASVNAQALQQVLKRLEQAFERRQKLGAGFPRFKKAGRMRSYSFPQLGKNSLGAGFVKLPSLGRVAIRQLLTYYVAVSVAIGLLLFSFQVGSVLDAIARSPRKR